MVYKFGLDDLTTFIRYALSGLLLFLIPQLIIHICYYLLNRGRVLLYDEEKKEITITINGKPYKFAFDDIAQIERNKSMPFAENRSRWFPWDDYNYSVIRLKNGQQFIITSLLVPNMDLPLDESKIRLRKRFYCYPFGAKEVLET